MSSHPPLDDTWVPINWNFAPANDPLTHFHTPHIYTLTFHHTTNDLFRCFRRHQKTTMSPESYRQLVGLVGPGRQQVPALPVVNNVHRRLWLMSAEEYDVEFPPLPPSTV